jgi:mannose-6-phosphate isomerase-like protein (cupin superfamily)
MREQQMAEMVEKSEVKNFQKPDEVREYPKGRLELVRIGGTIVGRARLEPGWQWTESLQPTMKTESCEAAHFQYVLSGTVRIRMDDGTEFDCRAGDVCLIAPGHKARVIGDEPVELVDFQGMSLYAESA